MRRIAWLLALLVAVPYASQGAKPAEPVSVRFHASAWVDVDASGKAHVAEMEALNGLKDDGTPGSLAEVIKARLRDRIESWEFEPPTRNDIAVSGKTFVSVSLEASDTGNDSIAIRILDARTGGRLVDKQMRELMDAMLRSGGWGRITVDVAWQSDGSVGSVDVVDAPYQGKVSLSNADTRKLAKATMEVVKNWRFDPEIVDGMPIPGEGKVPISFCLDRKCPKADEPEPIDSEPQFTTLDPAIGLRSAVASTVL
jgi:TonB family protein